MWERVRTAFVFGEKRAWREPFSVWIWGAWLAAMAGNCGAWGRWRVVCVWEKVMVRVGVWS